MQLVFYNEVFFNDIQAYQLDDATFTGVPLEVIEENRDRVYPILCFEENRLVCFFLLDASVNRLAYTNNQNSFLIRAFSTDSREVRKGYATKSLTELKSFITTNFEEINEVVLGVNVENINAYKLYLKAGFSDTNKVSLGSKGYQNILKILI